MAMRDYKFTLAANVPRSLNVAGTYFGVIGAQGTVKIQFDDGVFIGREQGMGGSADYGRVTIQSPIDQTVVLSLGSGNIYDSRATVGTVDAEVTFSAANSSPITPDVSIPALSTIQVSLPNAARKSIDIISNENNVASLRVGCQSGVDVDNGGVLTVGGACSFETKTGVWVYNTADVAQSVSIVELEIL